MHEGRPDTRVAMYVTRETVAGLRTIMTELHASVEDDDMRTALAQLADFFDCGLTGAGQRELAHRLGYALPADAEGGGLPEEHRP